MNCQITVYPPPLQGGEQVAALPVAGLNLTAAWGPQPGSATITYVAEAVEDNAIRTGGIAVGSGLLITTSAGHVFRGVCKSDVPSSSSSGRQREVSFVDLREYLAWDHVFCAFNQVETAQVPEVVGGHTVYHRRRRYGHILPADYAWMRRTYTDAPYTAAQILALILAAPTMRAAWTWVAHAGLDLPVYDLDWTGGRRLDNALSELGDRVGLTFTHWPGLWNGTSAPWRLRWARKGFIEAGDAFPVDAFGNFPVGADSCRDGLHLGDHPASVQVVGDRNRWQLVDVALEPDWPAAWTAFYDPDLFVQFVWEHLWRPEDPGHTAYQNLAGGADPDGIIARQLALARASEITVGEFASLMGAQYLDSRGFGGQSRLGMPVLLYLQRVVLRAFRLPATLSLGGTAVPTESVAILDELLCAVSHDPVTGAMTFLPDEKPDGNGYAVAQGYAAGREMYDRLSPDRFDLATWTSTMNVWRVVPFQWDTPDWGGRRAALFEAPMYRSNTLWREVDGQVVPVFGATFTVPPVRVALVVEAERFGYRMDTPGVVGRLDVVSEPGLHEEYRWSPGVGKVTLPYEDGVSALTKAASVAAAALGRPVLTRLGGFTRAMFDGMVAQQLNGQVDRVAVRISDRGWVEEVDFTTERGRGWEPVRDYARRQRGQDLFTGQAELRRAARESRVLASALRSSPGFTRQLGLAWRGGLGGGRTLGEVTVAGSATLAAGTPLWRRPGDAHAAAPSAVTEAHTVLDGVTTRADEQTSQPGGLPAVQFGMALCRVAGPVAVGDLLGRVAGQAHLARNTTSGVAIAREAVVSGVKLIPVWIGGSGGGSAVAVWQ